LGFSGGGGGFATHENNWINVFSYCSRGLDFAPEAVMFLSLCGVAEPIMAREMEKSLFLCCLF